MIVRELPIDEVKRYDNNPRHNETAVADVAKSIQEYGFEQPIVVDENHTIIVGDTRYQAAEQLGLEKVPVVVAKLSPQKVKEYRVVDNRAGEFSKWDIDRLFDELDGLDDFTGFNFEQQLDQAGEMIEEANQRNEDKEQNGSRAIRIVVKDDEDKFHELVKRLNDKFPNGEIKVKTTRWG